MSNLPNKDQKNLVNFLRENCPTPPSSQVNLEEQIMESIARQPQRGSKSTSNLIWTIPSAIATGFFFTSVSLGFKTPQVAIEAGELNNFLINSWNDTIDSGNYAVVNEEDNYWLLTTQEPQTESQQVLSLSAK